ncbi:Uncharacterised protein [Vibrio cholerae]|nr:Uncharacterised protein [Vibrio cholerae]
MLIKRRNRQQTTIFCHYLNQVLAMTIKLFATNCNKNLSQFIS